MTMKILSFAGSTRSNSLNQKLLDVAVRGAIESGAHVSSIQLRDYPLPFYCGDLEAQSGMPESAARLQTLLAESDALLIASPDYNGGYSSVLKNALDWMSRPSAAGHSGLAHFANKAAAVVSASPGPLGGSRGQLAIRGVLDKLGMLVIPQSFSLGVAHEAFDETDRLRDSRVESMVRTVGVALAETVRRLKG